MPSVVIAGGTSAGLGATIVQGILSFAPGWKPIVLSRASSAVPDWLSPLLADGSVQLHHVDYTDHPTLVSIFRDVHTVISVILSGPDTWYATQIALLNAAKEAGVKRFAPSEFGVGVKASPQIDLLAGNHVVWKACEESGLEWTRFENGLLTNYLGFAARDDRRAEALAGRENDGEWFYYTTQRRAELPVKSDGTFPRITMTANEDIGKYVAMSLSLPRWETVSNFAGDTLPMDQVVRIVEKITGQKWEIKKKYPSEIENEIATEQNVMKKMWLQLGLMLSRDAIEEGVLEPQLNQKFPELKPLSVEGYMQKYYS